MRNRESFWFQTELGQFLASGLTVLILLIGLTFAVPHWGWGMHEGIDPWFYLGTMMHPHQYFLEFGETYYINRLAWVLPGALFYHIGGLTGLTVFNFLYAWAFFTACGMIALRITRSPWVLVFSPLVVYNSFFLFNHTWLYNTGAAQTYLVIGLYLLISANGGKGGALRLLLAGVALTSVALTNFSLLFFAPIFVFARGFQLGWVSIRQLCGNALLLVVGFFLGVGLWGGIGLAVVPLQFEQIWESQLNLIRFLDGGNPWRGMTGIDILIFPWLWPIWLTLLVGGLAIWFGKDLVQPSLRAVWAVLVMSVLMLLYLEFVRGQPVLQHMNFSCYLNPMVVPLLLVIPGWLMGSVRWPIPLLGRVVMWVLLLTGSGVISWAWEGKIWILLVLVVATLAFCKAKNRTWSMLFLSGTLLYTMTGIKLPDSHSEAPSKPVITSHQDRVGVLYSKSWTQDRYDMIRKVEEISNELEAHRKGEKVWFWYSLDNMALESQKFTVAINSTYIWTYRQMGDSYPEVRSGIIWSAREPFWIALISDQEAFDDEPIKAFLADNQLEWTSIETEAPRMIALKGDQVTFLHLTRVVFAESGEEDMLEDDTDMK